MKCTRAVPIYELTAPPSTSPTLFEQWSFQRQHFLLSYLKTLSLGPAGV